MRQRYMIVHNVLASYASKTDIQGSRERYLLKDMAILSSNLEIRLMIVLEIYHGDREKEITVKYMKYSKSTFVDKETALAQFWVQSNQNFIII